MTGAGSEMPLELGEIETVTTRSCSLLEVDGSGFLGSRMIQAPDGIGGCLRH